MNDTEALIKALHILARKIQSVDGITGFAEQMFAVTKLDAAADRLQEQHKQIAGLRDPETMRANLLRGLVVLPSGYGETGPLEERIKRLEVWIGDLQVIESHSGRNERREWHGEIGWLLPGQVAYVGGLKP